MTTAYVSTVLDAPVAAVWARVRDFGDYRLFTAGRGEVFIEDGRAGDAVGAVRVATLDGRTVRQRLLGHSDLDRSYTYAFCGAAPFPFDNYVATLRVRPIIETGRTFAEWTATFDCEPDQRDPLRARLESLFAAWLGSLAAAI